MALTVDQIAKAAFDGVSAAITDAVADATLNDGATNYTGRAVFGGETAPSGFPMATAKDKVRPIYLEGFSEVADPGWTLTSGAVVWYVLGVRDIVEAQGFQVVSAIKSADMLWKTASFERKTVAVDSLGARSNTWAAISGADAVPVGLVAMSGNERWASSRVETRSEWRLICQPVSGLTEADRVTVDGRSYAIRFVNDVEARGVWHVIDLQLGAAP